jgi:Flp pilus assembly protein TadG
MPGRKGHSLWRDQHGSALIESAIVVPLLVVFFFGVFEFSWYFYQQQLIAIGLRDAASYLARSSDPCNAVSREWKAEQERAKNLATGGSIKGGVARVTGWTAAMVTLQCARAENPAGPNGLRRYRGPSVYVVTASTSFNYPSLGFFDLLGLRAPIISASYSERAIEPR